MSDHVGGVLLRRAEARHIDQSSHRHARSATTAVLPAALSAALLALAATPAQAIGFSQGDATLDINGTVNGFYSTAQRSVQASRPPTPH